MADKSISYRFLGKDAGLGKTMSGLGDSSERLHHTLGKLAGAFAGGIAGVGAVDFLKNSISDASDLNESLSKTRVVFGSASKGVEVFAKAAATSLGESTQQALEATSTFGNLFRALGIGTKPAADLSTRIVKLAGDLASFNNVDPAEALEALKSGLLGEAEPMRKFGVTLSAVRVQAEAVADGLVRPVKDGGKVRTALLNVEIATNRLAKAQKQHGAQSLAAKSANDGLVRANVALATATKGVVPQLTAAQKAQASYNIIMKDTKTAQGDFARTSGGLANQQRILKAEFSNASAQLGTKLYPAATKVVTKLSEALQPGSKFSGILKDLGTRAKEFGDEAKPVFAWIGDHPDLFTQIAKDAVVIGGVLKAKSFISGFGLMKTATGGKLPSAAGGAVGAALTSRGATVVNPLFVYDVSGKGAGGIQKDLEKLVGGKAAASFLGRLAPAFKGSAGGVGSLLLTSGDSPQKGGYAGKTPDDQTKNQTARAFAAFALGEDHSGAFTKYRNTGSPISGLNNPRASKGATASYQKAFNAGKLDKNLAIDWLLRYGGGTAEARSLLGQLGFPVPRTGALPLSQASLADDPRVARNLTSAAGRQQRQTTTALLNGTGAVTKGDLAHLLAGAAGAKITNNYEIIVNGLTIDQALNEAHRRSRVTALGATNTPASRDRG